MKEGVKDELGYVYKFIRLRDLFFFGPEDKGQR